MKITGLKYQVKNPDRVNVYLNGTYSLSLTVAQIVEFKLKTGMELDDEQVNTLKTASFDGRLLARALRWCYLRPRSEYELKTYLKRTLSKNKNNENIFAKTELIIAELKKMHAFNDEAFVTWWIERRTSMKKSTRMLAGELQQKGIDQKLIKEKLNDDDTNALHALIEKNRHKSKYADQKKFIAYLMSKGFRYSSVVEALAVGTNAGD